MSTVADLEIATIPVRLHAAGALEVPGERQLFIADPHFGKAAAFQQAGVPVPAHLHDHDLARLTTLIEATRPSHLIVLGDFFHSRHSHNPTLLDSLWRWRRDHASLAITVIQGNHDRHAGAPPPALEIDFVVGTTPCGSFVCLHEEPEMIVPGSHYLVGHIHPAIVLQERTGSSFRLPCFWVGSQVTTLPAFGVFTGGFAIRPAPGDRVFAAGSGQIREVTKLVTRTR
jgi:DNA ligase-associated metallophosphoesterase